MISYRDIIVTAPDTGFGLFEIKHLFMEEM